MICGFCTAQNDHGGGYCGTCGSPLRDPGSGQSVVSRPHPKHSDTANEFYQRGRAEERAEIAAYMRREAKHFAIAGEGLADPGKNFMRVVGGAIEGLAGFFEDGGHLR